MVGRPPPAGGGGRSESEGAARAAPQDAGRGRRASQALQWSLRSLHKIDTNAEHFLDNYYPSVDEEEAGGGGAGGAAPRGDLNDQTAYEIFKIPEEQTKDSAPKKRLWQAHQDPMRIGVVDGKKVAFELRQAVTQAPATPRRERVRKKHKVINADQSPWDVRVRFWLMHFALLRLTWLFLAVFLALNALFAGFFYALDERCCGDAHMTYANVFAFTVQTSTTIGYGGYSPQGVVADVLVIVLSYISTLINTLFAGLLFTKFATPIVNIQFSDVITMCNVNGVPCLTVRLGNAEGLLNALTDVNVVSLRLHDALHPPCCRTASPPQLVKLLLDHHQARTRLVELRRHARCLCLGQRRLVLGLLQL